MAAMLKFTADINILLIAAQLGGPLLTIMLLLLAAAAAGCLYYGFFIEINRLKREDLTLSLPDLPEVWEDRTLLYFSDLHLGRGMPPGRLALFCRQMAAEKPDLILFGGDLTEVKTAVPEELKAAWVKELKELRAPLGCYAVEGNHDAELPQTRAFFTEMCQRAGFTVLSNTAVVIDGLVLMGLNEVIHHKPDYEAALAAVPAGCGNAPRLVLFHEPDPVAGFPAAEVPELWLAGHSHNGQIRPFGLHLYLEHLGHRFPKGLYRFDEKNRFLYTSGGIGTVKLHARFAAPPEYVLIRLKKEHQSSAKN